VLTEIKNRGVEDVCITVCDGFKSLPEAITTVWERAVVQTCIVHYADVRIMPMWPPVPWRGRDFLLAGSA
jgi:transposase-like protein